MIHLDNIIRYPVVVGYLGTEVMCILTLSEGGVKAWRRVIFHGYAIPE